MPKFECQIRAADGSTSFQTVSAGSVDDAAAVIRSQGGYVMSITEAAGSGDSFIDKLRNIRVEGGPGLKDVISFSKQLAVMMKAGIAVHEAVEAIAEQVINNKFRKCLERICRDVEAGQSFSASIAKHPKIFSPLYVNMIKASEVTGTFSQMLERICDYLDQQYETRKMVIGAATYPAVLFTISVGAVIFLMSWVLPRFMVIFQGKEEHLPAATKALMAMSDFLQNDWMYLVGGAVAAVVALIFSLKTKGGIRFWDKILLEVPIIKKMTHSLFITRSFQALGELVNGGVPILDSLKITADIARNTYYREMWLGVSDSVRQGEKIVKTLNESDLMPRNVVLMIGAGEEAGRLGEILTDISDFYARELKETIKTVTALIEPVMIVFMGGIVGFIAISIIVPIFKMSTLVGK
jgi:type IV pilus assembly protein PilC